MDAWFNEQSMGLIGGIIGSSIGIAGAMTGCMSGLCVRKGWKGLIYGMFGFLIALSAALLITGVVALAGGQPYHVWYVFALPGFIGTVVASSIFPVVRKRLIENELPQIQINDI